MKKCHPLLIASILLLIPVSASALSDQRYRAIVDLGALNGVALQCKHLDQTRKMKEALIAVLPKRRALGQAFEIATNDAFLTFIESREACPQSADFSERVDRQILVLQNAFSVTTTTVD